MLDIDPQLFSISRPPLDDYCMFAQRQTIVETYHSGAGEMLATGALHRISINRTAHSNFSYRKGNGHFRRISRPAFTLDFQPASLSHEVDGDGADYISIFQAPELYDSLVDGRFEPERYETEMLSARPDPVTLQIALSLAFAAENEAGRDPLVMEHLSMALAGCVIRLLSGSETGGEGARPIEIPALRRVEAYVEEHLDRPDLSVEEMAGFAHMSHSHFAREFKKQTGLAPHRFVLDRRVARARLYLADGRRTLSDIAYATGFSSQAHFTNVFRRLTGVTPMEYRRSLS